jgi:hypothetical protein
VERAQTKAILRDLDKKMVLLSGPGQVEKSYLAQALMAGFRAPQYLNYDSGQDRAVIRAESWRGDTDLLILGELHKLPR